MAEKLHYKSMINKTLVITSTLKTEDKRKIVKINNKNQM